MDAPLRHDTGGSRPIRRLGVSDDAVWHCAVSPDGRRAIAIARDARQYELASGESRLLLGTPEPGIRGVAPIGRQGLLAWNADGFFVVAGHEEVPVVPHVSEEDGAIHLAAFLPASSQHFVLVRRSGSTESLQLFNLAGRLKSTFAPGRAETLWLCGVGRWTVACGRRDGTLHLWHFRNGEGDPLGLILQEHSIAAVRGIVSADGTLFASASRDFTIRIWSIQEEPDFRAQSVWTLGGHTDEITALAFTPDARKLISCSRDRTIRIWSIPDGTLLTVLADHRDWVTHVAVNPAGTRLASCSDDGITKLWDVESYALIDTAYGSTRFLSLAMSNDVICAGDAAGAFWILEYGEAPTVAAELARRYLVSGRVAGVGFRLFVQQVATPLGVRGSVRNLPDGRIEVHVIGSEPQHAAMKDALTKGPGGAQVTSVEEEIVPLTAVEGFSVVR
jgi:WD40 repeat protein/acylphosphatase